jgi:uncharacterized membrane protein
MEFLYAFFLLILVDLPWLLLTSAYVGTMVEQIQRSPLQFRLWPAPVVYLALAYLMTRVKTPTEAFLSGLCVYAVYDFTNLAMFKNYSPYFAVADSLWGGILFASVRSILNYIDYTSK